MSRIYISADISCSTEQFRILDIQEKPQENQRWFKMLTHVPNVGTYTQEALGGFSMVLLIKLLDKEPLLGRDIQQLARNFSTVLLHS